MAQKYVVCPPNKLEFVSNFALKDPDFYRDKGYILYKQTNSEVKSAFLRVIAVFISPHCCAQTYGALCCPDRHFLWYFQNVVLFSMGLSGTMSICS